MTVPKRRPDVCCVPKRQLRRVVMLIQNVKAWRGDTARATYLMPLRLHCRRPALLPQKQPPRSQLTPKLNLNVFAKKTANCVSRMRYWRDVLQQLKDSQPR